MSLADHANAKQVKCLAIDLGAASGRLVVGEILDGRWNLTEIGRFRTPSKSAAGYQCWDTDEILASIKRHLPQAAALGGLASLGIDSWGVDHVLLDESLRVVGVPVSYRDKRTTGMMERLQRRISREEIYLRTGIQFLPFNTLYQLAACAEQQPEWIEAARHFLMIPDYLHFRLSGSARQRIHQRTTTQMCGLDDDWDPALVAAVGIKPSMMRTPVAAGTILGDGNGAASGIKVIAPATHDTASAVAGTPLESADEAYISSGTWSLMGIETTIPIATAEAMAMNFTNEGGLSAASGFSKYHGDVAHPANLRRTQHCGC